MATLEFTRRPSVAAYMARALVPGFLRRPPPFPPLRARWRGAGPNAARLDRFSRLTGLQVNDRLPALTLQTFTFPLQMAILTHPSLPLPIWKVLQIRNHILQRRSIPGKATLDAEAAVTGERVLEKGLELDIRLFVSVGGDRTWESLTTYFYRGHFGPPGDPSPLAAPPPAPAAERARWRTDPGGGLAFAGISGDYNGIHWARLYARLLGFRAPFHHPLALAGQCLARLEEPPSEAQRLDLWLKGPVHYGSEVALAAGADERGTTFALTVRGSDRPVLVGAWREDGAASGGRPS